MECDQKRRFVCRMQPLGHLLMELRENGKLEYYLPNDIFKFISFIRVN